MSDSSRSWKLCNEFWDFTELSWLHFVIVFSSENVGLYVGDVMTELLLKISWKSFPSGFRKEIPFASSFNDIPRLVYPGGEEAQPFVIFQKTCFAFHCHAEIYNDVFFCSPFSHTFCGWRASFSCSSWISRFLSVEGKPLPFDLIKTFFFHVLSSGSRRKGEKALKDFFLWFIRNGNFAEVAEYILLSRHVVRLRGLFTRAEGAKSFQPSRRDCESRIHHQRMKFSLCARQFMSDAVSSHKQTYLHIHKT